MEYITAQSPWTKTLAWPQLDAILTWLKFWTITQASPWRSNIIYCDPKNIWIILLDLVQLIQDTALLAMDVSRVQTWPYKWLETGSRQKSLKVNVKTNTAITALISRRWLNFNIQMEHQRCGPSLRRPVPSQMTRKKRRISCFLQFKSSHSYFVIPFLPHSQGQGEMRWV